MKYLSVEPKNATTLENKHVCSFSRVDGGGGGGWRLAVGVEHENPPTVDGFPCSTCAEGTEHKNPPIEGGFRASCVRNDAGHENAPIVGEFRVCCA